MYPLAPIAARRIARVMSRAQLAAGAIRVYSVSATVLPQSARHALQEQVDDFYWDPEIQECCPADGSQADSQPTRRSSRK